MININQKTMILFFLLIPLVALSILFGMTPPAVTQSAAAIIYVDGQIGVDSCTNYDIASRSCGSGSQTAYATLAGASAIALPGDTVFIRQGTYNEQLIPQNSGLPGNLISYRNYGNETVLFTGSFYPGAIVLDQVSYITIEGLNVEDVRWLEATDAHHNLIRNNIFLRTPASGTTGNLRFISSDYNQIVENVLHDGNDNLLLIDSNYNLVEGNTITEGRHSVFSIRCSNFNIIRDNYFSNTQQKIGEVYDCGDDTSAVPHAFDATKYNVFENNVFAEASSYYSTSGGNGIQYAGQEGIIRRNVFYHTNVGLAMQVYGDEALYNHHNRAYHNVFYDNHCAGVSVRESNLDNVFTNNILYWNKGTGGGDCFGVGPAQILYRGSPIDTAYTFKNNNILNQGPGEAVIQQEFGSGNTLAYFESNHPTVYFQNWEVLPGFRDAGKYDFRLENGSEMIDAGDFLAETVSSGSGTVLPVDDARYFHDGFGIEGVAGDLIQLEGQTGIATIISIDYDSHTLTLDTPLSWSAGQGVSLAYQGMVPDIGAYEFSPELALAGTPANQAVHLTWEVNATLPASTTWTITYEGPVGDQIPPITGLPESIRNFTLTGLTNYEWYTITLTTEPMLLTDTLHIRPTDRLIHLPMIHK